MKTNYCYKVKHKFLKKRPDGSRDIENYFSKFVSEDGYNEIYSISYRLPPEAPIVRGFVNIYNDPKWQEKEKLLDRFEELEKEGLHFDYHEDTNTYTLHEDEETLKDFEMIRVCVDLDEDDGSYGYLFILLSDGQTLYYNKNILDRNVPDIIQGLLADNVIYRTISPDDKLKRKNKRSDA